MAKSQNVFVCTNCQHQEAKWIGQCPSCGEWSTMKEVQAEVTMKGKTVKRNQASSMEFESLRGEAIPLVRIQTALTELDRVLGGGLVPGGVYLLAGDPGIGKSTLLMHVAHRLSVQQWDVVYISGEESKDQVRMRAQRLGADNDGIKLSSDTDVYNVTRFMKTASPRTVMIIDSIQTMTSPSVDSFPGSVSQIKESVLQLIRAAKSQNIPIIIVCHVVKDGGVAGPKLLEHAVDAVLEFSGDSGFGHRILRASKNRFGSTQEIGVFEMVDKGLEEVVNPSAMFLSSETRGAVGSAIFPALEGSRLMLAEIQALVSPQPAVGNVRRSVVGWDSNRLAMIIAILDRFGVRLSDRDIFLNVAGGFKIQDPAADFAVVAALLSSLMNIPVSESSLFFGEVGLTGEIRGVRGASARLTEARNMGFELGFGPSLEKRMVPQRLNYSPYSKIVDYVSEFTSS